MAKTNAIECGECGETGWHAEVCCLYTGPVKPHRIGAVDRCSACAPDVDLCSIEDCNRAAAESTLDHADVLGNPARRCEHHLAIEDDAALADELDNESEATS